MPDKYGIFEQGRRMAKKFVKENLEGLYSVGVMVEALRIYEKGNIYLQKYHVRNAPEEMKIKDDETKVKKVRGIPRRHKGMLFFTREGAKNVFLYFRDQKKWMKECNEEEFLETLEKIVSEI